MVKYFSFGNTALIKSEEDAKKFFGKYLDEL